MYDIVIIGKGPAGIAASLYIARAGLKTLVIGKDGGALEKAENIQNYYGICTTGKDLLERGWKQATELEIPIVTDEVFQIEHEKEFKIKTKKADYQAKSVILATGTNRKTPEIKGIKEWEGKGVSYCTTCDAFFYRGKSVAVIGNGDYAIYEALELQPIVKSVTIFTNGKPMKEFRAEGIEMNREPISEIQGQGKVNGILLKNQEKVDIDGVFIAGGTATSIDFAWSLGAQIEENKIVVNEKMQTNIPGLYAAGDCTGGLLQIAKAVYDGSKAGVEAIQYIRSLR